MATYGLRGPTNARLKKIAANNLAAQQQKTNAKLEAEYAKAVAERQAAQKNLADLLAKSNGSIGAALRGGGQDASATYYYNAPMVSYAYFGAGTSNSNQSPQQKTYPSNKAVSDPGNYPNANLAWGADYPTAKGTIQMNASYASTLLNQTSSTPTNVDQTFYGFKFHYNPKEIGMAWALAEGVNWEVIQSGLDKVTPIGAGLNQTTLSFSIPLNRIEDMYYIDKNGLRKGVVSPYRKFKWAPTSSLNSELASIYKKGTMYDMEYLFRTVNGLSSVYTSNLNGDTADQGWLNGIPVELHLGDGLRYLVRITNLDINHQIFNDRMVPIFSTLNLTCSRFYDNITVDAEKAKKVIK